jgi:hypothetical protein
MAFVWPAIALVVIVDSSSALASKPSDLAVETTLAAYEGACRAIESYDLTMTTSSGLLLEKPNQHDKSHDHTNKKQADSTPSEWTPVDPNQVHIKTIRISHQYCNREKFRNDLRKQNGVEISEKADTQIWDGGVDRRLDFGRRTGRIISMSRTQSGFFGVCFLDLFRDFDGNYTYARFIRDRMENASVEKEGDLIVLATRSNPTATIRGNPFGVRLFLDPDRGFMPTRIDLTYGDDPIPQSRYTNELAEVLPGLWAPIRSRVSVFVRDKNSKYYGQELGYLLAEVDQSRSQFNGDIDPSVFDLTFPAGVMVHDEIRNTSYRAGAEKLDSYLDQLATQGRLSVDQLQAKHPRLRSGTVISESSGRKILIGVNLTLFAAVMVITVLRARRRAVEK